MKKFLMTVMMIVFTIGFSFAQIVIEGDITSDMTLTSNNTYLLRGFVRVQSGATLYIQPGTVIYGENTTQGSLIIKPGGKIVAQGTEQNPIVFTSEFTKPGSTQEPTYGDWGGIILLGIAPINVPGGTSTIEGPGGIYGGNDPNDSSGVMQYVRIEYPGIAFSLNNEINGLTFGGVGSRTVIDHIQVSYSGDDAYEWFGGNVNAKYLIAYRAWDDDFDTDFGFQGKLQFLVSLKDPLVADQSTSNSFESDNDASGSINEPRTSPTWWNVTLIGPLETTSSAINSLYGRGMHLRRSSLNKISNTIVMGWPRGIRLDGVNTIQGVINNNMWINNSIVAGWTSSALDTVSAGGASFDINAWFIASGGRTYTNNSDVMLTDPFNLADPNFLPIAGSPALTGAATPPNDDFFDPTATFAGAFGATDWTANWATWPVVSSVDEEYTNIISDFALTQNYPNPFNPSTKVSYSLPQSADVKLTVYNTLGQEVEILVDGFKNAGTYELTWDASNLPSGVYIYTIQSENTFITKKMTLLK